MSRREIIDNPEFGNKAEAFEAFDDIPTNPNLDNTIGDVIARRYGRREVLRGSLAVTAATALFGTSALTTPRGAQAATANSRYNFKELAWGNDQDMHIAEGYNADRSFGDDGAGNNADFGLAGGNQPRAVRPNQAYADGVQIGPHAQHIEYRDMLREADDQSDAGR